MMNVPMVTIMTRTFDQRPGLFEQHKQALQAQTLQDYQHLIIPCRPAGMHYANKQLYRYRMEITGHYVMILDDDDYLADANVLEELETVIRNTKADLIISRMQRPDRIVPDDKHFNRLPFVKGQIGSPCIIMHRNLAIPNLHFFGRPTAGDYALATELQHRAKTLYWWNRITAIIPVISGGKPERPADA